MDQPRSVSRRAVLATAAAGIAAPAAVVGVASAQTSPTKRPSKQRISTLGVRGVTLYAEELPGGLYGYGFAPGEATVPGPVLEIWEGDTLEVTLVNNTDKRLSIHPHGVDYSTDSDGSPVNASVNEPGETRTYTWRTRPHTKVRKDLWLPGSAGYWHYHDHAMGTAHGTTGLQKGLYGGLIVRRRGDLLPDRQFTCVFNEMTINNKVAPDTPVFDVRLGDRVEFIAIGHGNQPHTFHLHAHRWADTRTGMLASPDDPTPVIDNKNLDPGSSFGFQVIAGEGVGPGVWMYHCHIQFHSDGGMVGVFLVRNPDGSLPPGAQEALDRFHGHVHTPHAHHQAARS